MVQSVGSSPDDTVTGYDDEIQWHITRVPEPNVCRATITSSCVKLLFFQIFATLYHYPRTVER